MEPGHVICKAGGTRLPWGWLLWAAWIRSFLYQMAWPHKRFMSCHRCHCACRHVSENIENCSTSDDKKHYSFLLHSEVHNIPEHQFFWARSELGFYDGHMGKKKCSGHPPDPFYSGYSCWRLGCFIPCLHVSLSVPQHSTDGHSRLKIRSACKMLWNHLFLLFTQINLLTRN